jgi:hypothetical protein
LWRASCALAVGAFAVAFAFSPSFRHEIDVSVAQQPTVFTELYLDDHTALPGHVPAGTTATFSFTIANHEHRDMTYEYSTTVTVTDPSTPPDRREVAHGVVPVADGATATVAVPFTTSRGSKQSLVEVQLVDRSEVVHFEVTS